MRSNDINPDNHLDERSLAGGTDFDAASSPVAIARPFFAPPPIVIECESPLTEHDDDLEPAGESIEIDMGVSETIGGVTINGRAGPVSGDRYEKRPTVLPSGVSVVGWQCPLPGRRDGASRRWKGRRSQQQSSRRGSVAVRRGGHRLGHHQRPQDEAEGRNDGAHRGGRPS